MDFEYTKRYTVFNEPLPLTDLKTDNFYATNSVGIAGTSSDYELYVYGDTNITGILSANIVNIGSVNAKTANIGLATIGIATIGVATVGFGSIANSVIGIASIGIATIGNVAIGIASVGIATIGNLTIGIASVGIASVGVATIGFASITEARIGFVSLTSATIGIVTITGYQYRGSQVKTASLSVRGTGYNQRVNSSPVNRFIVLNGDTLDNSSTRGLTLTIIGAGLTHVSTTNYDTNGSTTQSNALATAITGISTGQIGIIASYDAWEYNITDNLRIAAKRVGLSKLGNFYYPNIVGVGSTAYNPSIGVNSTSYRRPYSAVFSGVRVNSYSSPHDVIERMESTNVGAPFANIFCNLAYDGVGVSIQGSTSSNALYSPDSDIEQPVLMIDSNNRVGVGTTDASLSTYNSKIHTGDLYSKFTIADGNFQLIATGVQTAPYPPPIGPYMSIVGVGSTSVDVYPGYNSTVYSNVIGASNELLFRKAGIHPIGFGKTIVDSPKGDVIGNIIARTWAWGTNYVGRWENAAYISFVVNNRDVTAPISDNHPSADIIFYGRNPTGIGSTNQYEGYELGRFEGSTGHFKPGFNNAHDLGTDPLYSPAAGIDTSRWKNIFAQGAVYAAGGFVALSDKRTKIDIKNSALGTEFIKSLKPVSYKWKNVDNKTTIDKNGIQKTEIIPGKRDHWGFIAQDVKKASDKAGVEFAGWILADKNNPDSQQGLRYDEFIAPIVKALQEALERIDTLEDELDKLKGKKKRARNQDGTFIPDDPSTPGVNEAWENP